MSRFGKPEDSHIWHIMRNGQPACACVKKNVADWLLADELSDRDYQRICRICLRTPADYNKYAAAKSAHIRNEAPDGINIRKQASDSKKATGKQVDFLVKHGWNTADADILSRHSASAAIQKIIDAQGDEQP